MIKLLKGDCLKLMKDISDKSVDMILCDLPYGTTKCKWDTIIPFDKLWENYLRIAKDNAAIVLFSAQPFTAKLIQSNIKLFRYEIIWEKTLVTGFLNAKKMPLRAHENICVFYKKLPTYNPIMTEALKKNRRKLGEKRYNSGAAEQYNEFRKSEYVWTETGKRYPRDVIEFSNWNGALFGNTQRCIDHPTSKPVPLLEYLIKTYTNEGDTVLDNCMGSGSTGVAAQNLNRDFIGIELNEKYFEIANKRINGTKSETKNVNCQNLKDDTVQRQLTLFEE